MFNRNQDLKVASKGIPNWAISEQLGVSEMTLYRWLRKELSAEKKQEILNAINEIKKELAKAQ